MHRRALPHRPWPKALDPLTATNVTPVHAGFPPQAARQGKAERDIMRHTGHRSAATQRKYIRAAKLFAPSNPAQGIGR